jgi:hypothetical protein
MRADSRLLALAALPGDWASIAEIISPRTV